MKGHQTRVTVCSSRYSLFDPDRWWEARGGIRTEVEELEKLLFDVVRHPISRPAAMFYQWPSVDDKWKQRALPPRGLSHTANY